jgi:L-aminopeptidase/D-esterase-like protein
VCHSAAARRETRETDLLDPLNLVDKVNAIVLAGGSAFGLDAAQGVVRYLEEHQIGWNVGAAGVVPIVPSAILFDLGFGGDPKIRQQQIADTGRQQRLTPGPWTRETWAPAQVQQLARALALAAR